MLQDYSIYQKVLQELHHDLHQSLCYRKGFLSFTSYILIHISPAYLFTISVGTSWGNYILISKVHPLRVTLFNTFNIKLARYQHLSLHRFSPILRRQIQQYKYYIFCLNKLMRFRKEYLQLFLLFLYYILIYRLIHYSYSFALEIL